MSLYPCTKGTIRKTSIWKNSNTSLTQSFSNQTISLSRSLDIFDYIEVEYVMTTASNYTAAANKRKTTIIFPKFEQQSTGTNPKYYLRGCIQNGKRQLERLQNDPYSLKIYDAIILTSITITDEDTGISTEYFESATQNRECVPLEITGINI